MGPPVVFTMANTNDIGLIYYRPTGDIIRKLIVWTSCINVGLQRKNELIVKTQKNYRIYTYPHQTTMSSGALRFWKNVTHWFNIISQTLHRR